MNINILTPDSKRPNLAAMKISAWHKQNGDNVELNFPLNKADFTYASVLFKRTAPPLADEIGGTGYDIHKKLDPAIDAMMPDYDLYPRLDYSIGYTYKACERTCDFCVVPKQANDTKHYSIDTFLNPKFKKICLMNNNTFFDPQWRDTFNEIIDRKLIVVYDNGYDARLITEEHAYYLSQLKFDGLIHAAWDYPEHEIEVLTGLCNLTKYIPAYKIMCYVLIGDTSHIENMDRVASLYAMGINPFAMPLNNKDPYQNKFARWVNFKSIFKTVRWKDYKGGFVGVQK